MIWLIPVVLVALLAVPFAFGVRRCLVEVRLLRASLGSFGELGADVGSLRADVVALRGGLPDKGLRTRPVESVAS